MAGIHDPDGLDGVHVRPSDHHVDRVGLGIKTVPDQLSNRRERYRGPTQLLKLVGVDLDLESFHGTTIRRGCVNNRDESAL
jgi:hypothetical protein